MRLQRLATRNDFQTLFSRGARVESASFRVIWRKNSLAHSRFAFVASRAVSKHAVVRNRLRRRAREWYRKHLDVIRVPVDLAIIFKKNAKAATRKKFYEELERTSPRDSA